MDARFYNSEDIDIERLANDLVNAYLAQGYQAQQFGNRDQMMVQLKKGGDFEAIIGMQAALSLTIQRTAGGVLAMIGQQRWIDKAAVGAVGIVALPVLWPLALTAGVGALRQASLGNQALNMVDGLVRQQRPGIQAGPIPYQILPQVQQQWAPHGSTPAYIPPPQMAPQPLPAPAPTGGRLRCQYCNTPYEPGDTFCTGCGRSLAPSKQYCSNCHFELKPGASFCPKCGASTYQPAPAARPASQAPVYMPPAQPQTPVHTPPSQQTPVYTPPSQPKPTPRPTEPYYTPPAQPQTPASPPPAAPAASSQPAARPAETYYTPPMPQTPPVQPQPKVTIVPGTMQRQPPPPPKSRPQKQYYIPSSQAQQSQQGQQGQQGQEQATQLPEEMQPTATYYKPPAQSPTLANQPTVAEPAQQQAPWGSLVFDDGTQISLSGQHAVVGRADHDIAGLQPDVDLSQKPGADTVSRIHAAFEHTGSDYTLTDLNSTNATRVNGKRLEPDRATPISDGDTLQFGKIVCTFKRA
jgi:hypothetical protein